VAQKSGRLQSRDPRSFEQITEKFRRVEHLCQQRIDDLKFKVRGVHCRRWGAIPETTGIATY